MCVCVVVVCVQCQLFSVKCVCMWENTFVCGIYYIDNLFMLVNVNIM